MTVSRLQEEMTHVELIRWEQYFTRKHQAEKAARDRAKRRR